MTANVARRHKFVIFPYLSPAEKEEVSLIFRNKLQKVTIDYGPFLL